MEALRRDTDNRERSAIDLQHLADDASVAAEAALPISITQDSYGRAELDCVIGRQNGAALESGNAQHLEVVSADQLCICEVAAVVPGDADGVLRIAGDDSAEDGARVVTQIAVGRVGAVLIQIAAPCAHTPTKGFHVRLHAHQLFGVADRQRAQQHLVKEAENGGRGAYAEGEHCEDRDGKDRRVPELAQGEAEIGEQAHKGLLVARARWLPL